MDRSQGFRLQADVVVVSATQLFSPGQIEIRAGRIVEVTHRTRERADVQLEGYALLPGLVNPHTHLEFSDLRTPLATGTDFPEWVGRVLAQRRARGSNTEELLKGAISLGLRESRAAGVAALADIVTPPWTPQLLARAASDDLAPEMNRQLWPEALRACISTEQLQRMREAMMPAQALPAVIACVEQLGLTPDRVASAIGWREQIDEVPSSRWPDCLHALALSPHAVYSTPEWLLRDTVARAVEQGRLIAMHIAESPAERQWIDSGGGPFAELHARLGVEKFVPAPPLIADVCRELAKCARGLLIHGNYLTATEMDCIAAHRDRLSVVFCPRTHRHFQHSDYPWTEFAKRGIRVVIGTDSRSSNPDLNLWQEARVALAQHGWLRPSQALAAISDQAAEALGCEAHYGTLRPGRVAAINVVPMDRTAGRVDIEQRFAGWFENVTHPIPLS